VKLGTRQIALLVEAGHEVSRACPWVWIYGDRRQVRSLASRGLVGFTDDAFGLMPRGCLALRKHDRPLARRALAGLRRERDSGGVMPWHV
jgi:hypothetical protein